MGEPPHTDSQRIAQKNGIDISSQRARKLQPEDGERFAVLIAMDRSNKRDIATIVGSDARVHLLREFDSDQSSLDVPDPYHGGFDGFREVFEMVDRSVERLLDTLCDELQIPK